jgi:hypothetical protein
MAKTFNIKHGLARILDQIQIAIRCAGDPHIDGRDEADAHMEAAKEELDELLQGDEECHVIDFDPNKPAGEKGCGA